MTVPVLFLESASGFSEPVSDIVAVQTAKILIQALRHTRRANLKISLNSRTSIADCEVAPGQTLRVVLGGPQHRDEWMFLRELATKSPFSSGFDELIECAELAEARTPGGQPSVALTWANLLETGTISFNVQADWQRPVICANCTYLDRDCNEVSSQRDIKNISEPDHAAIHREWLSSLGRNGCFNSRDLWKDREHVFPNLRFLDRVESQLFDLETSGVPYRQAISCLESLNHDALLWGGAGVPGFSVKVADGEHDKRRALSKFKDEVTDSIHEFDRHAYFTGGVAGRIHFRLVADEKKFVIGYVGLKL